MDFDKVSSIILSSLKHSLRAAVIYGDTDVLIHVTIHTYWTLTNVYTPNLSWGILYLLISKDAM